MSTIIQQWPGGLLTAAGGTRAIVKLNRPWQTDIVVNPASCPFDKGEHKVLEQHDINGEQWHLAENLYSPFVGVHKMILPAKCWSKERLRALGSKEGITTALRLALPLLTSGGDMMMGVNIGPLAGQTITHLHWHILPRCLGTAGFSSGIISHQLRQIISDNPGCIILSSDDILVAAGGHLTGECVILPNTVRPSTERLATVLADVVETYNQKFLSQQGLPPDYRMSLVWLEGNFVFGLYAPVLSHLACGEILALFGWGAILPAWPHEVTAAYLCS